MASLVLLSTLWMIMFYSVSLLKKKLNFLISMEGMMMCTMSFCFINNPTEMGLDYCLMIMMIMMVLESTYGISVLMSTSRMSSMFSTDFKTL